MVLLIITVVVVWLAQRLLAVRQAMRFRKQYSALRRDGRDVAVGAAKRRGRKVFVALAADSDNGTVVESMVFRGVTVFAGGRPDPRLDGCAITDLAAGRSPDGLEPLLAEAATQAAGFLTTAAQKRGAGTRPARGPARSKARVSTSTT